MTGLVLYDDARARDFEPFALTRPAGELRAGTMLVRQRWERVLGIEATGFVSSWHLADFEEGDAPYAVREGELAAGTIVANARFAPALDAGAASHAASTGGASAWRAAGRVAAVRLGRAVPVSTFVDGSVALDSLPGADAAGVELTGWWMDEVWDLIRHLGSMLTGDIAVIAGSLESIPPDGATVLGAHQVCIEQGALVEPLVVLDATAGPILVRQGAHVAAFTRLVGPCAIGEGSTFGGGRVAGCSIGDGCRVHGELSTSVMLGHANKSHDGFVGHSYLGRWTNLGAGTITSNLKNTYGNVSLWTPDGVRDTGMQFLGSLVGDHAKTAIGTRLTTGTVIGAGANVFGGAMAPKVVAPFAWGIDEERSLTYQIERFLEVAERVMARRHVTLGARQRRLLTAAHAARWRA